MAEPVTLAQVEALANQLPLTEQALLAQKILSKLEKASSSTLPVNRRAWQEIRGVMPYPMCGEDAQAWVSRTRREADEEREKQWKR